MEYLTLIGGVFIAWLILVVLFSPHIPYELEGTVDPRSEHFIHVLESTCNTSLSNHNKIDILTDGPAFYPAMIDAIRSARESINLEFENPVTPEMVREVLSKAPGIRIVDDPAANHFPMPLEASHQDDVLVGRIRQDISRVDGRGIDLFVAGDQVRKGAATNALQIAEKMI